MNVMNHAGQVARDAYYPAHEGNSDMPSVGSANSYKIARVGARPIMFRGTELAMCMSFTPELPYWYEMNIYRTDRQTFVLAIRVFFQSETEEDYIRAWDVDTISDVFDLIESYDAALDVRLTLPGSLEKSAPAVLAAHALELSAKVAAARAHFGGLVGEMFAEIEQMSL